jgi:arylsulfatase A-like enzyme
MTRSTRRDFLKLLSTLPLLALTGERTRPLLPHSQGGRPNLIILVLDAMSARHLGLYGYVRKNTPNLERFARHATVYHRHYSSGNFTVPGTASLLTGLYPWTHRSFQYAGFLPEEIESHNLFNLLGGDYYRVGYSQNPWGDIFLQEFSAALDKRIPTGAFNLTDHLSFDKTFANDPFIAYRAVDELAYQYDVPSGASLLAMIHKLRVTLTDHALTKKYRDLYPNGLPHIFNFNADYPAFLMEDVFDGLTTLFDNLPPSSAFAYFHIYPPHGPFYPRKDFISIYKNDGVTPVRKPDHPYARMTNNDDVLYQRLFYDQYIAFTDSEFGRLYDRLAAQGVFENSYVILTSDHGDLYERGIVSHTTPVLYEPLIHIPLLVSAPGQRERRDVFSPTNNVDLLPTLLRLADRPASTRTEGRLLPGLGGTESDQPVYALEAKENSAFGPLVKFTAAMIQGSHKLVYFHYPDYNEIEFFDLNEDPEELVNLYPSRPPLAKEMLSRLLYKLNPFNRPADLPTR